MSIAERVPPQNIEAEQAIIGACMLDKNSALKAIEILPQPGDFYRESHQFIYNIIVDLMEKNDAVDLLTVSEELRRRQKFDEVGGSEYLTSLLNVVATPGNVEYYAKIVREKAILRNLIHAGASISDLGYQEKNDARELLDKAESIVFNIAQGRITQDFHALRDILSDTYDKISELYLKKAHVTGLSTGYSKFDHMTAGLQKSDLIIMAARPGMGKTALGLNIALASAKQGQPVAFFSLEMSKEQLAQRLLCAQARIDNNRLRTGYLGESDWPRLTNAMNEISEIPFYIDDSPGQSVLEMRSKLRRLAKKFPEGLRLVVVDYIQLIQSHSKVDNRALELSEISRQLKFIAKEMDLPVIALSQLSRKVEERTDRRPILSDLRESGAIEQDADMVIFIYRDSYYKKAKTDDGPADNTSEIIIAKQRNGPTGTVYLAFLGQFMRFENLEDSIHTE